MIKATIPFLLLTLFACSNSDNAPDPGKEPGPAPGEVVTYGNESLVAVDPAGKEIAFDYRAPRDKKVGIFYFIWLGAPRLRHRRLFRRRHHPAEGHGHPVALRHQ